GLTFVMIVTTLGNFGQDSVLTREVARRPELLGSYFANTLVLKLVLAVPALLATTGIALAIGLDARTRDVVLILGVAVVAELLMSTFFAVFQAFERLELAAVALIVQRFATAAVGCWALVLGAGLRLVCVIYLGGALLGLAVAAAILFGKVSRPGFEVDPRRFVGLMRAAAGIGLAVAFALVLFRVDMVMLGLFRSDEVVGNYGAAYRLLEATLFLSWSVGSAAYPVFSRLTRDTVPTVGAVYARSISLAVALTLPLAAGAAVTAEPLVSFLYGEEYDRAAGALVLLAPTIALYPISYVTGNLLVSQGRQRAVATIYGLVAIENILGNLVLIPWLSLDGAALGTSISSALVVVALVAVASRTAGAIEWRRLAGPVLASALAALAMALLRGHLGLAVVAGAAAYLILLAAFEWLVLPEDARAISSLLRRANRTDPS
ncbi:MAG: flippase, partial [Gaiellaceae bacterium]